jgi:single-strand DNA-binding protein
MPNSFHGKGNLGDAPTLKTVSVSGKDRKVAEMRVMFDEYSYDETTKEYTQAGGFWLGVSIWDDRAENAARLLRKGCRVSVDGTLRQFMYAVEGAAEKVPGFQVLADDITLCMGRIESVAFKAKREASQTEAVPA